MPPNKSKIFEMKLAKYIIMFFLFIQIIDLRAKDYKLSIENHFQSDTLIINLKIKNISKEHIYITNSWCIYGFDSRTSDSTVLQIQYNNIISYKQKDGQPNPYWVWGKNISGFEKERIPSFTELKPDKIKTIQLVLPNFLDSSNIDKELEFFINVPYLNKKDFMSIQLVLQVPDIRNIRYYNDIDSEDMNTLEPIIFHLLTEDSSSILNNRNVWVAVYESNYDSFILMNPCARRTFYKLFEFGQIKGKTSVKVKAK